MLSGLFLRLRIYCSWPGIAYAARLSGRAVIYARIYGCVAAARGGFARAALHARCELWHACSVQRIDAELSRNFAGVGLYIAQRMPVGAARACVTISYVRHMPCARRVKPVAHGGFARASMHRVVLIAARMFCPYASRRMCRA